MLHAVVPLHNSPVWRVCDKTGPCHFRDGRHRRVVSGTPGVSRDRLLQQAERSWLPAALLLGVLDAMLQVSSFLLCLCFISSFGKLI